MARNGVGARGCEVPLMDMPEEYSERFDVPPIPPGGQATVVPAIRKRDGKPAAIKFFHPHLLRRDDFAERIRREGSRVWKLQHNALTENRIVPLLEEPDYGEGRLLVYMWMAGGSLADRRTEPDRPLLSPRDAASLVSELAATVDLLSLSDSPSPVHRDIHPRNILFQTSGWELPRLSDFGLVTDDVVPITQEGGLMGTPGFRPPEDPSAPTDRYDVYSLGAVLFFVLTGTWPPPDPAVYWTLPRTDRRFDHNDGNAPFALLSGALFSSVDATPSKRPEAKTLSDFLKSVSQGSNIPFVLKIDGTSCTGAQICSVQAALKKTEFDSSLNALEEKFVTCKTAELNHQIEHLLCLEELNRTKVLAEQTRFDDNRNLLFSAIEAGHIGLVKHLVDALRFPVDRVDDTELGLDAFGWTPLHLAASLGRLDILEYLLSKGADPLARTKQLATVAYEAAFCDQDRFQSIFEILKRWTTPEQQNELLNSPSVDRFTPLLVACWRGNYQSVEYLMSINPEFARNQQAENGEDALALAVRAQSIESVECIVSAMVANKWASLCNIRRRPSKEVETVAFSEARKGNTEYFLPTGEGERSPFELSGADVNARGRYRRTLLHEAAENGHYKIVEVLCEQPHISVLAHNNHGRLASDLVPKTRRDIALFLLSREAQQRHERRRSYLGGEPNGKS